MICFFPKKAPASIETQVQKEYDFGASECVTIQITFRRYREPNPYNP